LALASVPSFDPNTLDTHFAQLAQDDASPLLDRAISGLYPPGSTFKVVTAADALDAGIVSLDTVFEDPGALAVGNFVVHDDEQERTGRQTLVGAFALSSNVDFARIALDLGVDRWFEYAARCAWLSSRRRSPTRARSHDRFSCARSMRRAARSRRARRRLPPRSPRRPPPTYAR
jgi:cell division protein FtsI/penicillin-binding protein 2